MLDWIRLIHFAFCGIIWLSRVAKQSSYLQSDKHYGNVTYINFCLNICISVYYYSLKAVNPKTIMTTVNLEPFKKLNSRQDQLYSTKLIYTAQLISKYQKLLKTSQRCYERLNGLVDIICIESQLPRLYLSHRFYSMEFNPTWSFVIKLFSVL